MYLVSPVTDVVNVHSSLNGPRPAAVSAATLTEYVVLAKSDAMVVCVVVVLRIDSSPSG